MTADYSLSIIYVLASIILLASFKLPESEYPPRTRDEIMAIAESLATYRWTGTEANITPIWSNITPACEPPKNYTSDFVAGEEYIGIPYDWGGFDGIDSFRVKLEKGYAAGSHKDHGVSECTTGLDCSGFVGLCWGLKPPKLGTVHFDQQFPNPKYNWRKGMKRGDALVKAGSHIVLFARYGEDGRPIVYEAMGSRNRVVLNTDRTWKDFEGYYPVVYPNIVN